MVFKDSLANNKAFEKSLYKICEKKQVDRIILYYNALDEELKNQKIDYQKRYDQEFLRKNENLRDTFHSLPNAMSLAVKSVATSIDELKQAKTNKMRIQKALDVVKSTGKVAITPVAYVGKFLVSAWYSLLKFNGSNIKFDEKEKDISKKEMEKEIKINKIYDDFYDELFNNSKNESEVYKYQK